MPSAATTMEAVISFLVRVPVLSEQITVTQPRVSTADSFFTTAFLWPIRITPMARVTATTMGRPSGMAATARLAILDFVEFLLILQLKPDSNCEHVEHGPALDQPNEEDEPDDAE